jgi:hypothetical protein
LTKKRPTRSRVSRIVIGSLSAILIGAFLIWLNYGWILWTEPLWGGMGAFALHTLGDAWEREIRNLGGPNAIDCGRVWIHENRRIATDCAPKALWERGPFRVRYDLQGIDSDVSAGLFYTPKAELYAVEFDGNPSGHAERLGRGSALFKDYALCLFYLFTNPNHRLDCFSRQCHVGRNVAQSREFLVFRATLLITS